MPKWLVLQCVARQASSSCQIGRMMMHNFVVVATILTLAVGCTSQGDSNVGLEIGDDNSNPRRLAWPHTVVGSDGELAGVHPRGFGTFARFLGHYVRERNVVSLEVGIRKITSLPAKPVGIMERGVIRVES